MKVWVLRGVWYYDGEDILGIFSSHESAQLYKEKRAHTVRYDNIFIDEWTVDSVLNELKEEL
jgi:hypothetical protein